MTKLVQAAVGATELEILSEKPGSELRMSRSSNSIYNYEDLMSDLSHINGCYEMSYTLIRNDNSQSYGRGPSAPSLGKIDIILIK